MKICAKWTLLKFCPREGCLIVSWGKRGEEAERVALHFQASFPFPSITRGFLIVSSGDKSSSHHSDASLPLLCPMSVSLLSRPPAPVASVAHTQYGACNAETHFACRSNDNANIVVDFHVTEGKQELATVSELEIVSLMRLLSHFIARRMTV